MGVGVDVCVGVRVGITIGVGVSVSVGSGVKCTRAVIAPSTSGVGVPVSAGIADRIAASTVAWKLGVGAGCGGPHPTTINNAKDSTKAANIRGGSSAAAVPGAPYDPLPPSLRAEGIFERYGSSTLVTFRQRNIPRHPVRCRQSAKQPGISPAYLSYMVNGKRPWRPDLQARYLQLVNIRTRSDDVREPLYGGPEGNEPAGIRTQDTRIKSCTVPVLACIGPSFRIPLRTMSQRLVVLGHHNAYRPIPDSS